MEQEKITCKSTSYSVSIVGGKVDSLRVNEDLQTVIRVYDGGKIGIAGAIGETDEGGLLQKAKEKLAQNIQYPCDLCENQTRNEDKSCEIIAADKYVKTIKKLLDRLNKKFPDFIFGNKINMGEEEIVYQNSKHTKFCSKSSEIGGAIVIKEKTSANIMDLAYGFDKRYYDEDKIVEDMDKLLTAYRKKAEMPKENVPVIIDCLSVLEHAAQYVVAELYASGSSLLSGKLNQKVFNEKVNILTDRNDPEKTYPFFDTEGVVNPDGKFYFVKDGVFCGLVAGKRSASLFNLPVSGGGYAPFDEVPQGSFTGLKMAATDKMKNLVKGKAIYVSMTSGGDVTPDGVIGLPVQVAYLYEDGKLVGRLPEFGIQGNIFDLLGKDFIGVAPDDVLDYAKEDMLVATFHITL